MKYIFLVLLCLGLVGCSGSVTPEITSEPLTTNETAKQVSAPITPYLNFFQELIDRPLSEVMSPHFYDYKELPDAFVLSTALVDVTGDDRPEVLVAYSSDVPGAEAQTYTQLYRLEDGALASWGAKLPVTVNFYGLNQLIGTTERVSGKQIDRAYHQYQVSPEVTKVGEGSLRVIAQNQKPSEVGDYDQLITLAKTMATGTADSDLLVMDQPDKRPPFLLFNDLTYDQARFNNLADKFDLRYVNWQRLNSEFVANLDKHYQNAITPGLPEPLAKEEIDLVIAAIDRDMNSGAVRSFLIGDQTYYYLPQLDIRGMQHFRLIKAVVDGNEVYYDYHVPVYIKQGDKGHYLGDTVKQSTFLSLQQRLRSDVSRFLFRRFLLLDSYDLSIPSTNYEFMPEVTE